ncbi:MAG: DUF928 domain-containing protein [Scytonema sp. PMC 1070.18]|nr:DUF928 domain-containing protein [Scytonema sp. PMC 1070.18]
MVNKYFLRFSTFGLFLQLALVLGLPAQAQPYLKSKHILFLERFSQRSFIPPGQGKPKDTSGAGSRNGLSCSPEEPQIQPIMPKQNYGLTLQERPTIFVNLLKTSAQQVVLMFRDEAGKFYERAFLPITTQSGIIGFTLPKENSPLAVDQNYQWFLVFVCGETLQPDDPIVKGWVRRVASTSEIEGYLRNKTVFQQAAWYGAKGYWYDMLSTIVTAIQTYPHDANKLIALWKDLLSCEGLSAIASESLK